MPHAKPLPPIADAARPVAALAAAWQAAWNAHRMNDAASLVTADVEFVTVAGLWLRGRDAFLAHHQRIHAGTLRASRWQNLRHSARPLPGGLWLAHLHWRIEGERDADDCARPPREGLFTWVLSPQQDTWHILAAHNTNITADKARAHIQQATTPNQGGSR